MEKDLTELLPMQVHSNVSFNSDLFVVDSKDTMSGQDHDHDDKLKTVKKPKRIRPKGYSTSHVTKHRVKRKIEKQEDLALIQDLNKRLKELEEKLIKNGIHPENIPRCPVIPQSYQLNNKVEKMQQIQERKECKTEEERREKKREQDRIFARKKYWMEQGMRKDRKLQIQWMKEEVVRRETLLKSMATGIDTCFDDDIDSSLDNLWLLSEVTVVQPRNRSVSESSSLFTSSESYSSSY